MGSITTRPTSLCSPSRASIPTGLYAHSHRVVDNYNPVSLDLVFFSELQKEAGYTTAFFGKWHMGETDEPQRGIDHWAVFKGQGTYWPDGRSPSRVVPQTAYDESNINGERKPQTGYITDELTDISLEWLGNQNPDNRYFSIFRTRRCVPTSSRTSAISDVTKTSPSPSRSPSRTRPRIARASPAGFSISATAGTARTLVHLERAGTPIGPLDLLIGAHAHAHSLDLT